MALKNARFVHVQTPGGMSNGFSVYFYPHTVQPDAFRAEVNEPTLVNYTVAVCNKVDHFCKRLGREQCYVAEEKTCKVTDFPAVIAALECRAWGISYDRQPMVVKRHYANKYAWLFKYFL